MRHTLSILFLITLYSPVAFSALPSSDLSFFPDPKFKSCIVSTANENNWNSLSQIVSLNCSNKDIRSVAGLQQLTSLTDLNLYLNDITEIDLGKNISLTTLAISSNELTQIDVGKNVNLETLDLGSNPLDSLDLTNNIKLKTLTVGRQEFTSLDLSNNTELVDFKVFSSPLTEIDLSNNIKLQQLLIQANDSMTSIDLSNNINLDIVNITNNKKIRSLDVTHLEKLRVLNILNSPIRSLDLTKNPKLIFLRAEGNRFPSLDLSKNTELTELLLSSSNTDFTTLDISNNKKLHSLSIKKTKIKEVDLSTAPDLLYLTFENYAIEKLDLSTLSKLVSLRINKGQLKSIDLSNNTKINTMNLDKNAFESINISNFSALKYLGISDNNLSNVIIENNPLLESLSLMNNNISTLEIINNQSLVYLNLLGNPLSSTTIQNLENISKSSGLELKRDFALPDQILTGIEDPQLLDCMQEVLNDNKWETVESVKSITCNYRDIKSAAGIEQLIFLESLDLSNNEIAHITLPESTTLESVILNNNNLTSLDLRKTSALKTLEVKNNNLIYLGTGNNQSLEQVNVQSNRLGNLDFSNNIALATLQAADNLLTSINLANTPNLTRLYLGFNGLFGETFGNLLTEIDLSSSKKLIQADLSNNRLQIINLRENPELEYLVLIGNNIRSISLENNTALTLFDIRNNPVTATTYNYLKSRSFPTYATIPSNNAGYASSEVIVELMENITLKDDQQPDPETINAIFNLLDTISFRRSYWEDAIKNTNLTPNKAFKILDDVTAAIDLTQAAKSLGVDFDEVTLSSLLDSSYQIVDIINKNSEITFNRRPQFIEAIGKLRKTLVGFIDDTNFNSLGKTILYHGREYLRLEQEQQSTAFINRTSIDSTLALLAAQFEFLAQYHITENGLPSATTAISLAKSDKDLLMEILGTSSLPLATTPLVTQTAMNSAFLSENLTNIQASNLSASLSSFIDIDNLFLESKSGNSEKAITTLLENLRLSSIEHAFDPTTRVIRLSIQNIVIPFHVNAALLLPPQYGDKFIELPDGSYLSIRDNIALKLIPASADYISLFSLNNGDNDINYSGNGNLQINLPDSLFSGTFTFSPLGKGISTDSEIAQLIAPENNDPADPKANYAIQYPNGNSQRISPFVTEPNIFNFLKDQGISFRFSRNKGVFELEGTSYRPDYFVYPLSQGDIYFLNSAKNDFNIAIRNQDQNDDGLPDIDIISDIGRQTLYAIP